MLIDWFTVGAQTLNFLILVWLMKRFLYKPVLDAIDAREQRIASELANAKAKQAQASAERDSYQEKNARFERERAALLAQATSEARAASQRLLDQAHQSADALQASRKQALAQELQQLQHEIAQRNLAEVLATVRKVLGDLADCTLEQSITHKFVQHLRTIDGDLRDDLAKAIHSRAEPVLICSSFALDAVLQEQIGQAINQIFATPSPASIAIPMRFCTDPAIIGGIELSVNGRKLAFGIASHLEALRQSLAAADDTP
jgi:F-type H+-transporting ATPase subunit b